MDIACPIEGMRMLDQLGIGDNVLDLNRPSRKRCTTGLAIAREFVEMHVGRIWVESMLGKSSTFQMELPIRAEFRKSAP